MLLHNKVLIVTSNHSKNCKSLYEVKEILTSPWATWVWTWHKAGSWPYTHTLENSVPTVIKRSTSLSSSHRKAASPHTPKKKKKGKKEILCCFLLLHNRKTLSLQATESTLSYTQSIFSFNKDQIVYGLIWINYNTSYYGKINISAYSTSEALSLPSRQNSYSGTTVSWGVVEFYCFQSSTSWTLHVLNPQNTCT